MKRFAIIAVALAAAFGIGACEQDASKTDIGEPQFRGNAIPSDYEARVPDLLHVIQNVDNHPTLVKLCIDGLAFRSVSTNHQTWTESISRVPEWDDDCA
jgi:hypothetical protein